MRQKPHLTNDKILFSATRWQSSTNNIMKSRVSLIALTFPKKVRAKDMTLSPLMAFTRDITAGKFCCIYT